MNEYPDGWFRDDPAKAAPPGSQGPTVQLSRGQAAGSPTAGSPTAGAWPAQPPARTPGPGQPGRAPGTGAPGVWQPAKRRRLRPRVVIAVLAGLLCLALIASASGYFYLNSRIARKDILADYPGRPVAGAGQNWLITGSDSRQGLSWAQLRKLRAGRGVAGQRSDTIMVVHLPANGGRPVLVSLPRDSYVNIPGYGQNKLNAAYSFGGPQLLARTVQNITGLRIDHYMGIGFGGFVQVVDAVGGVRLCLKAPLRDPLAGLNLPAGCQVLNGAQALGYVRSRHLYATQDLQRIQNQRVLLRALLQKLTSASVLINPFSAWPAATGVTGTLTVDQGTSLYQLLGVAFALRNPVTTTVPIANPNYLVNGSSAVLWDSSGTHRLFAALRTDHAVPRDLITGSHQGG